MLTETTLTDQIAAGRHDRLRILICGAGVAGRTLTQLLRRQGLHPVLIDKAAPDAASGYMLALMPLVDPTFRTLGITDAYRDRSTPLSRYRILRHTGSPAREYRMTDLFDRYGDYRGISRGELLESLDATAATITHHTIVTAIHQTPAATTATIQHATQSVTAEFDLVVVADGINSTTRDLLWPPGDITGLDTGWGGWVTWADTDSDPDLGEELWGHGAFLGTYPVKDRLGVILCGPRDRTRIGPDEFSHRTRAGLTHISTRTDTALREVATNPEKYYWPLYDRRCARWSLGRVVALGDAAAGFLPTAGIGAAMAIESATVLAGHLDETGPEQITRQLSAYERAQRPRVQAAQDNSRSLARLMFNTSRAIAITRDIVAPIIPISAALRPIRRLLDNQPALD
ncbi:2-polyprenyl-6-methoxyphenol hydroxylase-like FAD-dependent oxidoreductase [Stackebrandtia endophytica]|uniref:2-polyprenyl-6-methoxyphenol hydroxylase-like FAD-dependent oxidoreductase n=1 Tax=Stackebrandtia endophytica TaxID=1496996 RepID=A0A543APP3_9ACTN|nr:NAD(P)/FAD-dependent oxidoreductase [Stackebrandtia endophytica]TQL74544.1 2-polyprenyl-6-methoxyphenol hydroxylase-like FAD-dependent oxidoreductase [Stackebrandtia endophytica]